MRDRHAVAIYFRGLPDLPQYDYLDLTIRCNLMWDVQINKLCSKLSQKVGLLFRLRHQVPSCMLMTVYNTMVQPILDYCITVWGYAPCTYIRKIQFQDLISGYIKFQDYSAVSIYLCTCVLVLFF